MHFKRDVERAFPLIKGWTSEALRLRQRGEMESHGFGLGYVDNRYDPAVTLMTPWGTIIEAKELEYLSGGEGPSSECLQDPTAYTLKLILTAKKVADSISDLMRLIMDAPLNIRQNESFNHAVKSSSALIGIKGPEESLTTKPAVECTQKLLSEDFDSPE